MQRILFASFVAVLLGACGPADEAPRETESRRPLARPEATSSGERRWFVLRHADLGLTTVNAWRDIGFDLDHRTTSAGDSELSRNTCKRRDGAHKGVLSDGEDGIDNNLAPHVLSLAKMIKSDLQDVVNAEIAGGGYTFLLRIDGSTSGDNAHAPGALYAAGPHAGKPTFTADDRWPVWSSTLTDGVDLEKPVRRFPLGYVRNGTWVSGEIGEGPEPIWLPLFGPLELNASALINVNLASGEGTIAGALPVSEVITGAGRWMKQIGVCPGTSSYDAVNTTIRGSADLVLGAPDLQDPSRSCDSISFGIRLELAPVAPPTEVVPRPDDENNDECVQQP